MHARHPLRSQPLHAIQQRRQPGLGRAHLCLLPVGQRQHAQREDLVDLGRVEEILRALGRDRGMIAEDHRRADHQIAPPRRPGERRIGPHVAALCGRRRRPRGRIGQRDEIAFSRGEQQMRAQERAAEHIVARRFDGEARGEILDPHRDLPQTMGAVGGHARRAGMDRAGQRPARIALDRVCRRRCRPRSAFEHPRGRRTAARSRSPGGDLRPSPRARADAVARSAGGPGCAPPRPAARAASAPATARHPGCRASRPCSTRAARARRTESAGGSSATTVDRDKGRSPRTGRRRRSRARRRRSRAGLRRQQLRLRAQAREEAVDLAPGAVAAVDPPPVQAHLGRPGGSRSRSRPGTIRTRRWRGRARARLRRPARSRQSMASGPPAREILPATAPIRRHQPGWDKTPPSDCHVS